MTHIDNISSIMKYGLFAYGNKYQKQDISDIVVNNRRSRIDSIYGKAIHSYVPFYFNCCLCTIYKEFGIKKRI